MVSSRVAGRPGAADVVLVTTTDAGSMDAYGRRLGAQLPVARLELDVTGASAGRWGGALGSRANLRALAGDRTVVRALRAAPGAVHVANHHLARYGPALGRPYLVTVHDLVRHADARGDGPVHITRPGRRDRAWLAAERAGIRRAAGVVAVSAATRDDVVARLGVAPERVHVVHEGLDHALFRPVTPPPSGGRHVLFVGSEHPRKDLPTLLRALAELRRDPRFADVGLVKVGAAGSAEAPFGAATRALVRELGLGRAVRFTGVVPDQALPGLYAGAGCLVLPSRHEGFGFPPLEAMACGCPAVTSTAGALPEVTGGAALLFEPGDVGALRDALARVLGDPACAAALRRRGLARAREFSWARAARETQAVYAAVLT